MQVGRWRSMSSCGTGVLPAMSQRCTESLFAADTLGVDAAMQPNRRRDACEEWSERRRPRRRLDVVRCHHSCDVAGRSDDLALEERRFGVCPAGNKTNVHSNDSAAGLG